MPNLPSSPQGRWRSHWTFVAAAAGSAVGLGNLWKFSYVAGQNGGTAFVLLYLLFVLLIGLPIMIAEVALGSRARANPSHAVANAAVASGRSAGWGGIAWIGLVAALLILSYYSVVGGWSIAYFGKAASGQFTDMGARSVAGLFGLLLADVDRLLECHSAFMLATVVVVSLGVSWGVGAAVRLAIPLLLLLLGALILYGIEFGNMPKALSFLFSTDWSGLTPEAVVLALGHAFFTLSIGMGAMLAYGAYLPDRKRIVQMSLLVVVLDTAIALLAGLAIFPLVFSHNIEPGAGPGLMFISLPYVFGNMAHGALFGMLFFLVVFIAALSSAVSLLEPATAWLVERWRWRRPVAASTLGAMVWALGCVVLLSFNRGVGWQVMGMPLFTALDFLAANILLPVSGFLLALFVGWRIRPEILGRDISLGRKWVFRLWYVVLRYIACPAVLMVLLIYGVQRLLG